MRRHSRSGVSTRLAIWASIVASSAAVCHGQAPDLLPDIPPGSLTVFPKRFISGLPVEQEFVTEVFTQRVGPTDLAPVPDDSGRIVVTTYGGTAYMVDQSGNVAMTPFLDLNHVASPTYNANFEFGWAHGLTTLAFHPDFNDPEAAGYGKFYTVEPEHDGVATPDFDKSVFVTDNRHDEALYEYTLDDSAQLTCDANCFDTKRELLRVNQPGWHHNLGDLAFDQNRLLYVSSGDGSTGILSENSQLLDNIFGKVLRIAPFGDNSANGKYGIPSDNPFVDGDGPSVDEIYAYGLRNPYRLDVDDQTDTLYASETGELTVESVNKIVAGGNHGWNKKEGSFIFDRPTGSVTVDEDLDGDGVGDFAESNGFLDPVLEYDHGDGRAIIGGVLYRGGEVPGLDGQYVFADFDGVTRQRGRIFYGNVDRHQPYEFLLADGSDRLPSAIHSVNEDANGNLYLLGIYQDGDEVDGIVLKLEPSPLVADFNGDGSVTCSDAESLYGAIRDQQRLDQFDLNGDEMVDTLDMERFLPRAADDRGFSSIVVGDANLDGIVDASDLNRVGRNWQQTNIASWCDGDFNVDGIVDARDLNALGQRWQSDTIARSSVVASRTSPTAVVPEPTSSRLQLLLLLGYWVRRKASWGRSAPPNGP